MRTPVKDFSEHLEYKSESTKIKEDNSELDILSILDETKPKQPVNAFFGRKKNTIARYEKIEISTKRY